MYKQNNMTLIEIVKRFEASPSLVTKKGNKFLADKFGVTEELIAQAKEIYNTPSSEEVDFETAAIKAQTRKIASSSLAIKSAWQNAKGEMQYSYKVDDKVSLQKEIVNAIKDVKPFKLKGDNLSAVNNECREYTLEIDLADLHIGKNNNLDNIFYKVYNLIGKARKFGKLNHIVIVNLGDLFNSDGNTGATTKGTRQFDSTNYKVNFQMAVELFTNIFNLAKKHALKVSFVNVQGNHDWNTSYYFGQCMKAMFSSQINMYVNGGRTALMFGEVSVMFDHGEVKKDYSLLFATEFPKEWASARTREIHLGHFHSEQTKEHKGCTVRHLLSSCRHDDEWHYKEGYIGNRVGVQAFLYNSHRIESIFYE